LARRAPREALAHHKLYASHKGLHFVHANHFRMQNVFDRLLELRECSDSQRPVPLHPTTNLHSAATGTAQSLHGMRELVILNELQDLLHVIRRDVHEVNLRQSHDESPGRTSTRADLAAERRRIEREVWLAGRRADVPSKLLHRNRS
jgi:hypothetical protein